MCLCSAPVTGLQGSSRRGDELPISPDAHYMSPGVEAHRAGGGEAVPSMAELGTKILVMGTGTQHDACLTPILEAPGASMGKLASNHKRSFRASVSVGKHVNLLTRNE